MKLRFIYGTLESASWNLSNLPLMKKVVKIEEVTPREFIVTFKPGTKYEYMKRAAGSATITLA